MTNKSAKEKKLLSLLPHNYRKIAAKAFNWPFLISLILVFLFLLNFTRPLSEWEKEKNCLLKNKHCFSARLYLTRVLLSQNEFNKAKKEIAFLEKNISLLNQEEKEEFQEVSRRYQHATREGLEILIKKWQSFLKKHPRYKIGWLYLTAYQEKLGLYQDAQESKEKLKKIDPGF